MMVSAKKLGDLVVHQIQCLQRYYDYLREIFRFNYI